MLSCKLKPIIHVFQQYDSDHNKKVYWENAHEIHPNTPKEEHFDKEHYLLYKSHDGSHEYLAHLNVEAVQLLQAKVQYPEIPGSLSKQEY